MPVRLSIIGYIGEDAMDEADSVKITVSYSKDADARWTIKGNKPYYGYKVHVTTDADEGFVLACHATPANVADTSEFTKLVDNANLPQGTAVGIDKGYASESNRNKLKDKGLVGQIMRKTIRNRPLSAAQLWI